MTLSRKGGPAALPAGQRRQDQRRQQQYVAMLLPGFAALLLDAGSAALHEALQRFVECAGIDDDRPEAFLGMAMCCMNLGDGQRALGHFDACLRRGFGSCDFASVRYERDLPDGDTACFEIVADHVCLWRAICHLEAGAPEAAAKAIDGLDAVSCDDLRGEIACVRAGIAFARGDPKQARRDLAQALTHDRRLASAHRLRGRLHEQAGHARRALRAYSRAIDDDDQDVDSWLARARLRLDLADEIAARHDLDEAQLRLDGQLRQAQRQLEVDRLRTRLGSAPARPG